MAERSLPKEIIRTRQAATERGAGNTGLRNEGENRGNDEPPPPPPPESVSSSWSSRLRLWSSSGRQIGTNPPLPFFAFCFFSNTATPPRTSYFVQSSTATTSFATQKPNGWALSYAAPLLGFAIAVFELWWAQRPKRLRQQVVA